MNIATDIDCDIDNDKVCISFKNKEINNCLKEYAVDYKKDNILIEYLISFSTYLFITS